MCSSHLIGSHFKIAFKILLLDHTALSDLVSQYISDLLSV